MVRHHRYHLGSWWVKKAPDSQTVTVARRDGSHSVQTRWNIRLSARSPRPHRPVISHRQTVVGTCGDRHHVTQACWDSRLATGVQPPRQHFPVGFHRQTMVRARGNRHDIGLGVRRHGGLAGGVLPPCHHFSAGSQRETMFSTFRSRDGHYICPRSGQQ